MRRLNAIRQDVAALGVMAPFRVAYEVGKRSGAHGLLLKRLAARPAQADLHALPAFIPARAPAGEVRERCLADARLIVDDGHRAFGRRVRVEGPDDWNVIGDSGVRWPSERWWWEIDIRTDARIGDVKWTWELGRHRDLVVLARAAWLEPDALWHTELVRRLRWWFATAQPERGVHWYSNLEIALRVIAWIQIYALVGDRLPDDVRGEMARHVAVARRHLLVDFPYTASSMRNNHLLGDALGLLAIERFTGSPRASRVSRIAERAFAGQLSRHMRPDGSMIEDSLSYHRFVLEMLVVKLLLGDDSSALRDALAAASTHLVELGATEGSIPQWGDWDEGRVLASSGDPVDVAGSVLLGLTLTARGGLSDLDEVAWYAGRAGLPDPTQVRPASDRAVVRASGGQTHVRIGDWAVWFKCGTGPSHQHADLTHVSASYRGEWVLVDPGTGTYNGELEVRNAFRTSESHNGLRLLSRQMFEPHRAFRWLTSATPMLGQYWTGDDAAVVWGLHDAFVRHGDGRVARVVVVQPHGVTCLDWREGAEDADLTIALPATVGDLPADVRLFGLDGADTVHGQASPFAGYVSRTYGTWQPATWLQTKVTGEAPTWWGMRNGNGPEITVGECGDVLVDGLGLHLTFGSEGARLDIRDGEGQPVVLTAGSAS